MLGGDRWLDLCNRNETVYIGDEGARVCDWKDSSFLTVGKVFPQVSARLLGMLRKQEPIEFSECRSRACAKPYFSIIIPVGGRDRLHILPLVLDTFYGQSRDDFEIIVVEHSSEAHYHWVAHRGVVYEHIPMPSGGSFNKSLAFNRGVSLARGEVVVLHDADVLVPCRFLESVSQLLEMGYEAVRPMRFLFGLGESDSKELVSNRNLEQLSTIDYIHQNFPGLNTALRKAVYWAIGGHDERFVGWGGEDNEFLERLETRKLFKGAYTYGVHLWHPPAVNKAPAQRNKRMFEAIMQMSPYERMEALNKSHVHDTHS